MHSIRIKITAITIAAILTTILTVIAACYSTIQVENDNRSVEVMNLIGEDASKSLEIYFDGVEQAVEMASNIAVDTLDGVMLVECGAAGARSGGVERTPEQTERLDRYLSEYCARVQESFESVASRTTGAMTYYYCISPEISSTEHGFFYSVLGKTGFGPNVPIDAGKLDPKDVDHNAWYFTPIQRGRPSWVGPYKVHFLGETWVCSFIVPVYKAGALIGVVGMDIPVETLASQIRPIQVFDTGFACLFDENGKTVYHPRLKVGSAPEMTGMPLDAEVLKRENSGNTPVRYSEEGQKMQMSFSTLSNGMKLVITAPQKEINESWTRLSHIVLLSSAGVIVFYAVLLFLVMRIITFPLQRLTAASRKLAAADYDVDLDYEGRDEVGVLTDAFKQMRDQIRIMIDDLNRRIYSDALTGLPNMWYFFQLAEEEKDRLTRSGKLPVMLYLNLIGMKHFNRQYGFEEGDRLLCSIADVLVRNFGEKCVCRIGQDHFTAVTDEENLEDRLQKIIGECEEANGGRSLPVRIGIYQDKLDEVRANIACDHAKYACDRCKRAYVSDFNYFDIDMLRHSENIRYITSHLDRALREKWIEVYYQPIVRTVNGRVCDEECLARWIDPVKGMLSPADFIPILEETRLIYRLDLYVLEQVLEKIRKQKDAGLGIVPHSVNLSRSDFDSCDIVEEIRSRVDGSGVGRNWITIEITESIIGRDLDFIKSQVERFRSLGFSVWIDDFGSGYSSLDVLQSIQFDMIKFDMSFMKRLDEGDGGKIILTEMMKMASALGVETVCEGVETREQVRFLQEIGCSRLQGFYFCKAIPFDAILDRYKKGIQIGFEDPQETSYFDTIGRANIFDLAVVAKEDDRSFRNYFNSMPMCIMEVQEEKVKFIRSNQSYRDFMKRFFGMDLSDSGIEFDAAPEGAGSEFMKRVRECCSNGDRVFFDEQMESGLTIHSFARSICKNPVTGKTAVAVAVLSITEIKAEKSSDCGAGETGFRVRHPARSQG